MSYNIVNEIGITYSGETEMNSPDNGVITSPLSGKAVKLENVPDPTFAQGILGLGAAIEPTEGKVAAPADGKVETLFDTLHAVGLTLDNGKELLIHIGINTVALNGEGFIAPRFRGRQSYKGPNADNFRHRLYKKQGIPDRYSRAGGQFGRFFRRGTACSRGRAGIHRRRAYKSYGLKLREVKYG